MIASLRKVVVAMGLVNDDDGKKNRAAKNTGMPRPVVPRPVLTEALHPRRPSSLHRSAGCMDVSS